MKEQDGKIFVATINDVPVGLSRVKVDISKKEAWLSAARTAPEHRRKGVATAIAKKCLEYAKQKGARKARLVTSSNNKAARIVLQKLGFVPIAEFVEMTCEKIEMKKSQKSRMGHLQDLEQTWNFLQNSEVFHKSAGLYTVLFRWYSLLPHDLEFFIRNGKAIVYEYENQVQGLLLIDDSTAKAWQENTIQTCYVDGNEETLADMLRFLLTHCYKRGIKRIYGFTCKHNPIIFVMKEFGFKESDDVEIVYEKRL
jgi:N-acetylglutamate synthase-like GNAT family acetyltransferase